MRRAILAIAALLAASPAAAAIDPGARALAVQAAGKATGTAFEGRKTLLIFGNSVAGQSGAALVLGTTTTSASAAPGAASLVVASSSGFTAGSKVAISLYTQEVFTTTVAAVPDATHLTLNAAVPKMVRSGAFVQAYTTPRPAHVRQRTGVIAVADWLLGSPLQIVDGYGYGGGLGSTMLPDLSLWLRRLRPDYVWLQFYENDIPAGISLADLQRLTRAAVRISLAAGVTPIVSTPGPSASYSTSAMAAVFDGLKSYVLGLPATMPGMIAIDDSSLYLDTGAPSSRPPLAGWTDGVHPNNNKMVTIGANVALQLAPFLPPAPTRQQWADAALFANADMTGTGGSIAGAGSATGAVSTGWTVTIPAGVTATLSKTAADAQRIVFSIAGASDVTSSMVMVSRTFSLPANLQGGQGIRAVAQAKFNAVTGLRLAYVDFSFSTGEVYAAGQDDGVPSDPALVGRTITQESPPIPIPEGATTVTLNYRLRPYVLGSPSGVSGDVELSVLGLLPADLPVGGGIVLP